MIKTPVSQLLRRKRARAGSLADKPRWLICPKPHLRTGQVDLVEYELDCMKNPAVCHAMSRPGMRKPLLIPRKIEDLPNALQALKGSLPLDNQDQTSIKQIEQEFVNFTRRYAEMAGVDLEYYVQQFQDNYLPEIWDSHPLLTPEHRETLALGKFLWEQIDKVKGHDYSGPGLHFSGVFEALVSANHL